MNIKIEWIAFTELGNIKNFKLISKFSQETRQDFHRSWKIGKENLKTRLLEEKKKLSFSKLRKLRPERTGKGVMFAKINTNDLFLSGDEVNELGLV